MNQLDWDSLATLITEAVLARLGGDLGPRDSGLQGSGLRGPGPGGVLSSGVVSSGPAMALPMPGLGRPAKVVWVVADVPASDAPVGLAMELAARAGAEQWVLCPTKDTMGSALARMAGLGAEPLVVEWSLGGPARRAEALRRVRAADRVLALGLGWSQARALQEADDRDFSVRLLIEALMQERPVRLLGHEDLGGLSGAAVKLASAREGALPGPLARKTREALRSLSLLGIELVDAGQVGGLVASVQAAAGSQAKTLGGLVTAKDVASAKAEGRGVLELPKGTVVTPLARDEARKLGVELRILEG